MNVPVSLVRRASAEFAATGFLAAVIVGSGIAASERSPDDTGLQLLESTLATALALGALIALFAPVSGAHFNPVVSLVDSMIGLRSWRDTVAYVPAQVLGGILGVCAAHAMFGEAVIALSTNERLNRATFFAEIVATAGLILLIFGLARSGRSHLAAMAVAAYVGAGALFTSSGGFINPAITVSRILTDTFSGISPQSALGFIAAQTIGALLGLALVRWFFPIQKVRETAHRTARAKA